jgi:hypothetical protein
MTNLLDTFYIQRHHQHHPSTIAIMVVVIYAPNFGMAVIPIIHVYHADAVYHGAVEVMDVIYNSVDSALWLKRHVRLI